ncbi:Palmitoyltransferase [Didymella heteroderae]|uniref:Palmitoyltransferase n=1 Tax=Didymella heteroderae TaxID=1769908 RepID=A0A9P4WTV5_9PLEO|nr:Palmitoyltransferase [Didymella heteroderae]
MATTLPPSSRARAQRLLAVLKVLLVWTYVVCGPVFFAAQAIVPVYFLDYELTATIFSVPVSGPVVYNIPRERDVGLAAVLVVLLALPEVIWLAAIAYCLYTTWVTARNWRPLSHPDETPVQMDPRSLERRWCHQCEIFKGNRTYHCKEVGKCLPFLDHFCVCWFGAVWGYNIKAYLAFLTFLLAHQLGCLAVGCWVLDKKNPYHHTNWPASAVGLVGLNLLGTSLLNFTFWKSLACRNQLLMEKEAEVRVFRLEDGVYEWTTKDPKSSPWNLGVKNNLRFALGPWWSFPLFWTFSPVKEACRLEIFEMKALKASIPFSPVSSLLSSDADLPRFRRRTRYAATTGFEETSLPPASASSPDLFSPAATATRHVRPYTDPF